jgi:hypothetical protein
MKIGLKMNRMRCGEGEFMPLRIRAVGGACKRGNDTGLP